MKQQTMAYRYAFLCAIVCPHNAMMRPAVADTLEVTSIPPGYTSSSIELGVPFGGSLAIDPAQTNILYATEAVGFSSPDILRINTETGTTMTVATGFSNVGGIAVLSDGSLAVTDNSGAETIHRLRDLNMNGDFLDAGEVTELIAPILTNPGNDFTGAQIIVAPEGNASAIPAGSLVVQTADGGNNADVLVIENPTTTPAFRPAGSPYFSGFSYNGGIAFDPVGNLVLGSSEFPTGRILALVNTNADTDIDASESNVLVGAAGLPNSVADLAVTADGQVIYSENTGTIKQFALPGDLLAGTGTPAVFLQTNGNYLSTVRLDVPGNSFAPNAGAGGAKLYLGGFVSFPAATNLLVIRPASASAVAEWQLY